MRELLELRHEEGALLGHHTYAHLALVPKMAGSPGEVLAFVRELADRARPHADREVAELRQFAARELGLPDFQAWDRAYAAEQLRQSRYAFSEQDLKRYFTEPRVLAGLFPLVETLVDVAIPEDRAPPWPDSVRFYRVWRGGAPVAGFYLDPHAPPRHRLGAWLDGRRAHRPPAAGRVQEPRADRARAGGVREAGTAPGAGQRAGHASGAGPARRGPARDPPCEPRSSPTTRRRSAAGVRGRAGQWRWPWSWVDPASPFPPDAGHPLNGC